MTERSLIVCGLPGSGKTTFLAALWHVAQSGEIDSALNLASFDFAEYDYVNEIRERWLQGRRQSRTVGAARTIGVDLVNDIGDTATLLFPDHSGETFDTMWSTRACSSEVADTLVDRQGVLLFIGQDIKQPTPLTEIMAADAAMLDASPVDLPAEPPATPAQDWRAEHAPDQVKIVDTLQTLSTTLGDSSPEKLGIFVSAWDLVDEGVNPETFIEHHLPMLHQYLLFGDHGFDIRFYGVSAQGGEYTKEDFTGEPPESLLNLLALETASTRIRLLHEGVETHDLTEPIAWVMS